VSARFSESDSTAADDISDMMDDELTRLLAEGKTARARQILSQRSGRGTTGRRSPGALTLVLLLAVSVAIAGAVIYGMSFLGLRVLERLQPVFDPIVAWLAPPLVTPAGLGILGLLILAIGLPRASKFRRPARFRGGIVALAAAFGTFWPLQFLAARIELPFPEWSVALHILSGFISICLLTGGLEAIRMANNTPEGDSWEFLN
jgi:hypothetical protein